MPRLHRLLPGLLATAAVAAAAASDPDTAPTRLPAFFVPGERVGRLDVAVPRDDLRPPPPNLGQELLAVPGVYGQTRATDTMEPNIRGLSFDRVATTLDGIPLVNASPERTNSPVVLLGPAVVTGITVLKALPSVTLGPVTTGGRIVLDTAAPAPTGPLGARLDFVYDGARDGVTARSRVTARAGQWNATATAFCNDLGDYTAADGRRVAARLDDHGASVAVGWRGDAHDLTAEFLERRLRRQESVSLPLDGENTEAEIVGLRDDWTIGRGALERIRWRAGYARTDPYITNEDRHVPGPIHAQGTARSGGGGIMSLWRAAGDASLSLGGDFGWKRRRAVRTTPAGQDTIWPDAVSADTGVFAEWRQSLAPGWRLRLGGRVDDVHRTAHDADQPALGRPLREQWVRYNGPAAARVSRRDTVGAANAVVQWQGGPGLTLFTGAGLSAQAPGVMECYRGMLNALGGDGHGGNAVELGNPALRPERKLAFEAGGTWRTKRVEFEATAYAYRIDDFFLRTPVGTTDSPLPPMLVFGYRNIPAEFHGAEAAVTLKPASGWRMPVTFALAEGRNRETGTGLPEIPPWDLTAALQYHGAARRLPLAAEIGAHVVGRKSNPAPLEDPLFGTTGGFSLLHARLGLEPRPWLRVEAGIENLLNRRYSEYLTPPVAPLPPASGNLRPGDRVPGSGRSVWVSVTLTWP